MKVILARSLVPALVVLVAAACETQTQEEPAGAGSDTTEIAEAASAMESAVGTLEEVWNTGNYDLLDAVVATDYRRIAPDQDAEGIEGLKAFMRQVRTTYPDFQIEFTETAFDGDVAFAHWTVTATHTGEGAVPATGNPIEQSGITMLEFQDGRIAREFVYYDTATLNEQLGVSEVPHVGAGN